jgi:hypothetical protein
MFFDVWFKLKKNSNVEKLDTSHLFVAARLIRFLVLLDQVRQTGHLQLSLSQTVTTYVCILVHHLIKPLLSRYRVRLLLYMVIAATTTLC